ncbi:MAG TPA: M48 family metalloprotease [Gemmatimonadales bacterium]|nr:M48 family metalloprotease [Gemmatimonadales bacterium]
MRQAMVPRCLLAVLLGGCATNPATGKNEISLVSESQEISLGEQTAAAARAAIGDYPDSAIQRYVRSVGIRLAARTERPALPWNFEVVDDPEVNAFAAPGGKIFVTRGILSYLGSEAELAGVLGHESGHVTARHTAREITRQQLFGIGLIAGSILSSRVAQSAGAIQQGLQLLFLSYSRANEAQADELGFRYMRRLSYDPREMTRTFETLGRVEHLSGGGKVPTWAATHPDPGDRLKKAQERAAAVPADSLQRAVVNRESYLRVIDGIVFGVNPRQGYFEGTRFLHPELRFRIDFPSGWQTQNQADAVLAVSPQNDAALQLSLGGSESPEALLQKFAQQQGVQSGNAQRLNVNGNSAITAEFQAQDAQGTALAGRVMYLAYGGTTYQLLGYSTAARYGSYSGAIARAMQSFAQLTDSDALNKQPVHLALVRLPRAMTIEEFYRQYPSPVRMEIIAAINGVEAGATLPAGMLAKRVQ